MNVFRVIRNIRLLFIQGKRLLYKIRVIRRGVIFLTQSRLFGIHRNRFCVKIWNIFTTILCPRRNLLISTRVGLRVPYNARNSILGHACSFALEAVLEIRHSVYKFSKKLICFKIIIKSEHFFEKKRIFWKKFSFLGE